mgnify:CR=1 FL=1|tara:strand:+ start:390 stop:1082 length:693 start_codon:yes stop_codon:yes gene_type:complete
MIDIIQRKPTKQKKKFSTQDGYKYTTDDFGVIHQVNPQHFKYDSEYIDTYKTPAYREASALLMGIRLGSVYSNYISKFKSFPSSILDIGYGDGSFLKSSDSLISSCYGYDVTNEPLPPSITKVDELNDSSHYDIITMWDVYEHLHDLDIINKLNFDLICFSMPDVSNKNFEEWKHRKPNEHIHHFTPQSLTNLMNSFNLVPIHLSWQEDTVRKSKNNHNIMTMMFVKNLK